LADDDTWVNVPALLDLASAYHYRCPVSFGYVWSHVWIEDFDYISGGAGLLLSQRAFLELTPAFYTDQCPFAHYNDITFGRCAWTLKVQMVHHRGFYFDPPERSKDRHEVVWFPPIAEAITYHYVYPSEMEIMTNYANERWQWTPVNSTSFTLQGQERKTNNEKDDEGTFAGHVLALDVDMIEQMKKQSSRYLFDQNEDDLEQEQSRISKRLLSKKALQDLQRHL